jgi:choline monooxygenase
MSVQSSMAATGLSEVEVAAVRRELHSASLLPPRVYSDSHIFELERERIFARSWLPVCHVSQIRESGQYVASVLGGEAVVAVRGADGAVRVMSNVCRHRNTILLSGAGSCKANRILCPYHGWTYRLDGSLVGAPFMDQAQGFDKSSIRLPEFRSEIWHGFVMVNFDAKAKSLREQLAGLEPHVAPYRFEDMEAVEIRRRTVPWNWKVSLENFSEAYHQPWVHPLSAEHEFPATKVDYRDIDGPYGLFWLYQRDDQIVQTFFPPVEGLPDRFLRCVTVFNVYPYLHVLTDASTPLWLNFNVNAANEHELIWTVLMPKGSAVRDGGMDAEIAKFKAFIEPILNEDVGICTGVGIGVHSRYAGQGRLSHMEKTVHQFHNWWLDQMMGDGAASNGR